VTFKAQGFKSRGSKMAKAILMIFAICAVPVMGQCGAYWYNIDTSCQTGYAMNFGVCYNGDRGDDSHPAF